MALSPAYKYLHVELIYQLKIFEPNLYTHLNFVFVYYIVNAQSIQENHPYILS